MHTSYQTTYVLLERGQGEERAQQQSVIRLHDDAEGAEDRPPGGGLVDLETLPDGQRVLPLLVAICLGADLVPGHGLLVAELDMVVRRLLLRLDLLDVWGRHGLGEECLVRELGGKVWGTAVPSVGEGGSLCVFREQGEDDRNEMLFPARWRRVEAYSYYRFVAASSESHDCHSEEDGRRGRPG